MDNPNDKPVIDTPVVEEPVKNKKYFAGARKQIAARANAMYTEFKQHPTYYVGSAALRLAVGAGVGYGMYYGLTALAAPYLAPVVASTEAVAVTQQVVSPIMQKLFAGIPNLNLPNIAAALPKVPEIASNSFFALTNIVPKAISAVSALSGLLGVTKLSDKLLTGFFGEIKIKANLQEDGKKAFVQSRNDSGAVLRLFGIDKPYVTPVSEICAQLEQAYKNQNKDKPDVLAQSKTFALAFTKQLVEEDSGLYTFDQTAKAEVNTKLYTSAAKKVSL